MTDQQADATDQPRPAGHRRFHLVRTVDHTGVTGTGVVAEGVAFSDYPSTVAWPSLADALTVHGHGGHTTIQWVDHDATTLERSLDQAQDGRPVVGPSAAGRYRHSPGRRQSHSASRRWIGGSSVGAAGPSTWRADHVGWVARVVAAR